MMDIFDLTSRTVLVTGAGNGLGRSFAYALANRGAKIVCADIDRDAAEETIAAITGRGQEAVSVLVDVADEQSVDDMTRVTRETCGGLDILINNASVASIPGRLLDISIEDWHRVTAVNLRGMFLSTRALMPLLLKSRTASVINLSSFLGVVGLYPGFPIRALPYSTTKAGVIGFTRQLAKEYALDGVRVNAIAPGWHSGTKIGRARLATAGAGGDCPIRGLSQRIDSARPSRQAGGLNRPHSVPRERRVELRDGSGVLA